MFDKSEIAVDFIGARRELAEAVVLVNRVLVAYRLAARQHFADAARAGFDND